MAVVFDLREQQQAMQHLIATGDLAGAAATGRFILQHHSRHLATYRSLAWVAILEDQPSQAVDLLGRVISADPEDGEAWAHLAQALHELRQVDQAVPCWILAFDLRPWGVRWPRPVDVRARVRNIQWGISERGRVSLTPAAFAHALVRGQRWQQAASILRPLIADGPERQDLKLALSQALWHMDDRQAAYQLAHEVQARLPNALKANLLLAEEGDMGARQRATALDPLGEYQRRWFGET